MRAPANLPIPKLPLSQSEIIGEAAAVAGLGFLAVIFLILWPALPERIPTHFSFSGQPNAWGAKNTELPIIFIVAAIYAFITIMSRLPRLYKFPVPVTAENIARQYRIARSLVVLVKVEAVWGIALLQWRGLLASARGFFPVWEIPVWLGGFVAVLFSTILWYLRQSRRAGTARGKDVPYSL